MKTRFILRFALALSVVATASEPPLPAQSSSLESYEHFLYLRHDLADGVAKTDSLVIVRATNDNFEAKAVYSEGNLHIDWHPLGVANGKLYAVRMGALLSVDLERGTASEIEGEWRIGSYTWSDGKLYAFVKDRSSPQANLLRVYDTETEAYRDIGVPPHPPEGIYWESWPPKPQVSPDQKWLAYFYRSTNFMSSYMHRLILVAVDDGQSKTSEISVAAKEFMTGSSAGTVSEGPPFCWIDSKTLLVVRDISTNHFSFSWGDDEMADMILSRVDVEKDRVTEICPLPRFRPHRGEPFFRMGNRGQVPRLVIGRLGQYRIEFAEPGLVKDADIGGGYSYTRGSSADQPDELRFKDKVLESERVIPEIAVSPDGRRVAWHARVVVRPMSDADASKIRFYDPVSPEARTVGTEWIPDPNTWNIKRSYKGNLIWISTSDLTPRNPKAPAGWKHFSAVPHVR